MLKLGISSENFPTSVEDEQDRTTDGRVLRFSRAAYDRQQDISNERKGSATCRIWAVAQTQDPGGLWRVP